MPDSFEVFESRHQPVAGRTLVVGSRVYPGRTDRRARFADVIGVDMLEGSGVDRALNLEDPLPDDLGTFQHIDCVSVLEHSPRPWLLAANLERLLAPGGSLLVAVPFVWRIHGYPHDYFRFTPDGVRSLFPSIKWDALEIDAGTLLPGPKIPVIKQNSLPHLARSQVVGFGHK